MHEVGQAKMDFSAVPTDPQDILRYCGGLVTIDNDDDGRIGLAHFSVKEFLLSDRIKESEAAGFRAGDPEIEKELTAVCVSYISMTDFKEGQCLTKKRLLSRLSKFHFLNYAANFWVEHYRLQQTDHEDLFESIYNLFHNPELCGNFLAWRQIEEYQRDLFYERYNNPRQDQWGRDMEQEINLLEQHTPLCYAAQLGLKKLVHVLVEEGDDLNAKSVGAFEYPVLAAAFGDAHNWDIVRILVDAGADINVCTCDGNLAFAIAFYGDPASWGLLKELVRRGIDLETQNKISFSVKTVIGAIARHPADAADMVRYLIEAGADYKQTEFFSAIHNHGHPSDKWGGPPL
jgi:hypothetical protein